MIIHRILTNNAVVVVNERGKEKIVCGKGIAYKKKPGQMIDENIINQTFVLAPDHKIQQQLEQLLMDLPLEFVELANEIVCMARMALQVNLSDSLIISLADHIYETMRRYREGIQLSHGMIWEIQRFYETEYEVGLLAKNMVERAFGVELPDDEAAYIAVHIVNAETEGATLEETMKMTNLIRDMIRIVRIFFGIDFDEKSGYYYRFVTHLKYFAKRILKGEQFTDDDNAELAAIVFEKYYKAYECTCKVGEFVQKKLNYQISDEEKMYITIHIHAAVSKGSKKERKEVGQ